MASENRGGQDDRSKRGSSDPRKRRAGIPWLESLEDRRLLTGVWKASTNDVYDVQNGPMANLGATLIGIYRQYNDYVKAGSPGTFNPSAAKSVIMQGTNVAITVTGTGDYNAFQQSMRDVGMNVQHGLATTKTLEGFIPAANLYRLATSPLLVGASPNYKPIAFSVGLGQNQGENSLNVVAARTSFNVDGTGQKVGVISTSLDRYYPQATSLTNLGPGGLPSSVATGDLPNNVQTFIDAPQLLPTDPGFDPANSDEGRAMLEQIHDIAPGAQLAFASAFAGSGGLIGFADNITGLSSLGAKVIVDDIGILNDTAFQDSPISDRINGLVQNNSTVYLSSAGNSADGGYLSTFRGINATVGSLGAGRYMNFDPSNATQTPTLGLLVGSPSYVSLQFDQPVGNITSNIQLSLLDASGNVVAQSLTNPLADQSPFLTLTDTTGAPIIVPAGSYQVAVKVLSGADPGHIFMYGFAGDVAFDKKFGSAGGTYYPTTYGHNAGANTISVGAVPFWGTPPYQSPSTIVNEPYSSFGPNIRIYNVDGTIRSSPLLLKPDLSATDANNTSFFIPGATFDTSTQQIQQYLSYPGNAPTTFLTPRTPTNVTQANLPIFTGTSSAAPNLAAIVALMKQSRPNVSRDEILNALTSTATPLNGAAKGTWNPQGGFGLANAQAALAAISTLQVVSVSPGSAATLTQVPSTITVTFNKPVSLATLANGGLTVVGANGATVRVGAPIGVDNATFPTVVQFPISIVPAPGRVANGTYTVIVNASAVRGQDGTSPTSNYTTTFNLQQTVAPTVASTTINGRFIQVKFNGDLNPATVNQTNLYVFRTASPTSGTYDPGYVVVSNLPGAVVSYNASTRTATIDLSAVPQTSLPSGRYLITATNGITDTVGNPLNGQFSGVFPSGINPSSPAGTYFVQDLGVINVQPPLISSLILAPGSDTGIPGDNDTNSPTPSFIGQVTALFPNTNAGLQVYAQFNGISHPGLLTGGLNLGSAGAGRGVVGQYDVIARTDANGRFTINYPAGVSPLPEGQNQIRVVVVGQPDAPNVAGLSSSITTTFQVDRTLAYVGTLNGTSPTSVLQDSSINSLSTMTISVVDPVNPTSRVSPFAVNAQTNVPALNPTTANNLANYSLYLITGVNQYIDQSSFIKNAVFASTSNRVLTSDPFTGTITLSFAAGLPQGRYVLYVRGPATAAGGGVTDAAGNSITSSRANSASGTATPFSLDFNLQPTATYITNYGAYSADTSGNQYGTISQPRASYEVPLAGTTAGAPAPPTAFTLDFSNQLAATSYLGRVILARSADSAGAKPDGDFGNFGTAAGLANPNGWSQVTGLNVQLVNAVAGATQGQPGYLNRLFITLPAGATLTPDYYRLYLPNSSTATTVQDVYGSTLDGEFLGYQDATGKFVNKLNDGSIRGSGQFDAPDLSGDGVQGGAFVTGFVVVPNGNVIYARPDAIYNPQLPSTYPDGSQARPYSVLAPEATYTAINGGDLNSTINSGVNFNPIYDRAGLGTFQPSAFFAAQEKARLTQQPVVIVAQAAFATRDPLTGVVSTRPFVLQAPAGSDPVINDASAAVPAMTTLIFAPGSTLKMLNAALLVQNQGSALQITGGPNPSQIVNITSYKDATIGGATNGDASQAPASGDYGGILFRNYNQADNGNGGSRSALFPGQVPITGSFLSDGRLKGPFTDPTNRSSQLDAVSGADPVMSYINFLVEKYAGGNVPQTFGTGYDGITLQNSRPSIVNTTIALAGVGSAQSGLSVDVDSLRKDDIASGPLFRNLTLTGNNLNGIYVRAQVASGRAEPTNATNLAGDGYTYAMDDPYPYLFTSRLTLGSRLQVETSGQQSNTADSLFVDPGMLVKFSRGAGIGVASNATINIGDRTYISQYFSNSQFGPTTPGFKANSAQLAKALFTSLSDDVATTNYTDPISGATRTVVAPLIVSVNGAGSNQPTPTNVPNGSRWGGISIANGAIGVINSAVFRYGGGEINTDNGTGTQHVLEIGSDGSTTGAHLSITNNTFDSNIDVPINLSPNAIRAGDPTRPLLTGNPFIKSNTFVRNGYNAVGVQGGTPGPDHPANLTVNSTWTGGDYTYLLRDTIVVGPQQQNGRLAPPPATLSTPPPVGLTLTLQSTLPGTVLADGTVVAAPGIPLVIKTQSTPGAVPAETSGVAPGSVQNSYWSGGAGFIVGVDNGIDPPTFPEAYIDNGLRSQIRILGIPGNQSTNQVRVPVIITSVHDQTVGTTSNGVTTTQVIPNDQTAPQPGDGGIIYFGANSLSNYNFQDLRSGSVIDNADIRYMTRIEQQGSGPLYLQDLNGDGSFSALGDSPFAQKYGIIGANALDQYNTPKKLTISSSNLSSFSDGGVVAQPGVAPLVIPLNFPADTPFVRVLTGVPTQTYIVNSTISNMNSPNGRATGLQVISQSGADSPDNGVATSPALAVVLNSTFYNNTTGISTFGEASSGANPYSAASVLAMDNIFVNQGTAMTATNQNYGSQSQYNLFFNNTTNITPNVGIAEAGSVFGDPLFRDAANGNFNLKPGSAAIDAARSELTNSIFGDMLSPVGTYYSAANTNLNQPTIRNTTGNRTFSGGFNYNGPVGNNTAVVTLPGSPIVSRGFPDQWVPTLTVASRTTVVPGNSNTNSTPGTAGNGYINSNGTNNLLASDVTAASSTYSYRPLEGERDLLGNLRVPTPGVTPTGFGSRPYFDLGAYEYIVQVPPVVTSVNAVSATTGATSNLYIPNGIAGTNQYPSQIRVGLSERLNPATISAASVLLVGSGGDGNFNSGNEVNYNLANRLSFDNSTNTLVINTAGLLGGTTAANDQYLLTLKGTGSAVLRDQDGLALDGNTNNNAAPLPSGVDNYPGSDFSVQFTIDTNPPALVAGTFGLAPGTFKTSAAIATNVGFPITNNNRPTFVGRITDIFPPANPLQGDRVFVDISTSGDPNNFNLLGVATGTTDATGNFSVTASQAIPDTNFTVGPDGKQGTTDDTGGTLARVRVVDQAGNVSFLTSDPYSSFIQRGAGISFQIDTQAPQVTSLTPTSGTLVTPNSDGTVTVTATFSKNIDPATLNANSVLVTRAGGTGTFVNGGIAVPIVGNFNISYLGGGKGPVRVSFNLQGPLPNDFYRITLKGTGANPVRDIAGNALDGLGTGVAGSGDYVNTPFTVFSPGNSRLIYVDGTNAPASATATQGSRLNPFATIAAGINAAQTGDVVLVLPGTYREQIKLKAQVRVLSADSSSTDTGYLPGSPLSTIIYGNTSTNGSNFNNASGGTVVLAQDLATVTGVPTELSGFTILSPLLGDNVRGTIDTTSVGIALYNSNVLVDKNYVVNAGIGINISTTGTNVTGPQVVSNVIAGNINGIGIADGGTTVSYAAPTRIINNTIVDNTYGLYNVSSRPGVTQATILNSIFYNNHALTSARTGTGILSMAANTLDVAVNLFYANGVSGAPSSNAIGTFAKLNPAFLSAVPDANGNFLADPAFVAARDPRPNGDTAPTFFVYGNYDLTSRSPAINAGLQAVAPATDILYRQPVAIAGKGFNGSGPASIGAFYYMGTGTITVTPGNGIGTGNTGTGTGTGNTGTGSGGNSTGPNQPIPRSLAIATVGGGSGATVGGSLPIGTLAFNVVNTSLDPDGGTTGVVPQVTAPTSIDVNFSNYVDKSSVTPSDLVLSGSGLDAANPAHATSLTWVDNHTVRFLLTGGFNSNGSVKVSILAGAVTNTKGDSIAAFAESFQLGSDSSVADSTVHAAVAAATTVTLPVQPIAVAGPIAVHYNAAKHKLTKAQAAKAQAAKAKEAKAHAAAARAHAAAAKAHKVDAARKVHQAKATAHAKAAKLARAAKPGKVGK